MKYLTTFKELLIESLKDNKKMIIIFYVAFILLLIGGWIVSSNVLSANPLPDFTNTTTQTPSGGYVSAIDLFIHNEMGGIIIYLSSIFFGIAAIVSLAYNGMNIGATGALISSLHPNGGLEYIIYLIPHGIFEFTATVIESTAGILLFLFIGRMIKSIIRSDEDGFGKKISHAFEMHKKTLIQSLILMVFATILLIIAAPIEAYLSVPISNLIVGN